MNTNQTPKKIILLLAGTFGITLFAMGAISHLKDNTSSQQTPSNRPEAHGAFLSQPHLIPIGSREQVQWRIPAKCDANAILMFKDGTTKSDEAEGLSHRFGGIKCAVQQDDSWVCTADVLRMLSEMTPTVDEPYDLYAVAEKCEDDAEMKVSEPLHVSDIFDIEGYRSVLTPYLETFEVIDLVAVAPNEIWASAIIARQIKSLFRIQRTTDEVVRYDVSALDITIPEFALDARAHRIIYSTFIQPLEYEPGKPIDAQKASLHLYDLDSYEDTILVEEDRFTPYAPSWVDSDQIMYSSSSGDEVVIDLRRM